MVKSFAAMAARIAVLGSFGLGLAACAEAPTTAAIGSDMRQALSETAGPAKLPPLKLPPPQGAPTVQFLPFAGVPVNTADDIYRRIRTHAPEEGLNLVLRLEDPATYRVRGYFVALGGDAASTVVFTYEIFDASGRRVHSFTGQELAKQSDGDPWSGIDTVTDEHLARRAVQVIKAWVTRAGA